MLAPRLARYADRIAVSCRDQTLTFTELDEHANQVAHQLRALGVGRGDVVGLFLERSIELEPALLGVLRAGAAYVPVDTGFPAERVRYILSDAAVRVVLTLARLELIGQDDVVDGERLAERLDAAGVTFLQGTPATWGLLRQVGWRPGVGFSALVGAERVPVDLAVWLAGGGASVWHMYGPTET